MAKLPLAKTYLHVLLTKSRIAKPELPATLVSLVIISVLVVGFFIFGTQGIRFAGFAADDAIYLLTAEYFLDPNQKDGVLIYTQAYTHLPPLYPLLLAGIASQSNLVADAFIVQTACLMGALIVWARIISRESESKYAFPLALLGLSLMPGTVLLTSAIWTEFLYLLLIGLAIESLKLSEHRRGYLLAAAVIIGLSAITRGFGLVAIIALALSLALHRRFLSLGFVVVACVPYALSHFVGFGGGSTYLDVFFARNADLAAFQTTLEMNLASIYAGWVGTFAATNSTIGLLLNMVLLPFGLTGFYVRLRRLEFDAIYLLGYVALLLIWPFPEVAWRLTYPAIPVFVLHCMTGARFVSTSPLIPLSKNFGSLLLLLIAAVAIAESFELSRRYRDIQLPESFSHWRASRAWLTAETIEQGISDIAVKEATRLVLVNSRTQLPPKACIYSDYPHPVMFYARRASWPALKGDDRPVSPGCEFHLLVSDKRAAKQVSSLWPHYEIVAREETEQGAGAILVRYPL